MENENTRMKGKKMCYSLFFFKEHIKRYIIVIFVFFMITCTNQIKLTQHGNIITAKNCNGNGNTNLFWGNNGARNIFGRTTKRRNPFASIGAIVNEKISNKNKKKQNEMFGKFAVVGTPNETTKKYNDIEHDAKERDTTSSDFQLNCDKPKFIKEENVNYENKTDKFIKTLPKEVNLIDEEQAHDSIFSNDKIDEVISKKDNTSKSIINSIFQNIWGSNNSSKSQDYNKGNDNGGDGDNNKNEPNERDDRGRKNERDEKGISYEEPDETNFLLKALNSGKFPNYCLVENIDENADNFDIYMSKEKMKELNINDGYTILLKGKKKKEMVGIAREDDRLNKYSVTISFSMKRNLRLMHNDIIKIYPLSNIKNIKNVIVSPFSDTVNNITKEEIEKEILNTYLKNSYKPLSVDSTIYINYKNKRIELKVLKIITQDGQSEKHGCLTNTSRLTLSETFLNREDYEENTDDINYEDLGGMKKQLNKIRELIELPLKYPEIFMSIGISAPKGVLMHGIPGTGKTSIAKAIANESNAYCYIINGPEIMSKHIGESEQKLRKIFKKASEKTPCIIFIDEIDSIANKRNKSSNELEKRVVSQLLTLMDG